MPSRLRAARLEAFPRIGPYNWCLLKITTDEGLVGWGEGPLGTQPTTPQLGQVKALLQEQNLFQVERVWRLLQRGPAGLAQAAELALWDLAGKALDRPAHELLGGKLRDRVRLYADCHAGVDWTRDEFQQRVRSVRAGGTPRRTENPPPGRCAGPRRPLLCVTSSVSPSRRSRLPGGGDAATARRDAHRCGLRGLGRAGLGRAGPRPGRSRGGRLMAIPTPRRGVVKGLGCVGASACALGPTLAQPAVTRAADGAPQVDVAWLRAVVRGTVVGPGEGP
jgi:hypothetical protein